MNLKQLSMKWLQRGVTSKEIMRSICPTPYKEQGKAGLAIAIKELNECLAIHGLIQPEDAKIYIKMIEMVLSKYKIGHGQLTEAFEVLVNHKISNTDLDFNRFGRAIDYPFLDTLIKRYVIFKRKQKHIEIREHIESQKEFIPAPDDGFLKKIETIAKKKNAAFQESKSRKMDKSRREALKKRLGL